MLARRLPGILPTMSLEESLEVTRIHSVAGLLGERAAAENPTLKWGALVRPLRGKFNIEVGAHARCLPGGLRAPADGIATPLPLISPGGTMTAKRPGPRRPQTPQGLPCVNRYQFSGRRSCATRSTTTAVPAPGKWAQGQVAKGPTTSTARTASARRRRAPRGFRRRAPRNSSATGARVFHSFSGSS
jgi:hypothetical protein